MVLTCEQRYYFETAWTQPNAFIGKAAPQHVSGC